ATILDGVRLLQISRNIILENKNERKTGAFRS
ncbi:MAG: hypothetical protein ACJARV_000461, partial [Candidatus Pseudothioglobus sp.]